MLKILLTVAVIWAIYFFFIKKPQVTEHRRRKADEADRKARRKEAQKEEEIMVPCEKCGTYISSHEAIIVSGKYYCSKSCAGVK
ncbi:PP0621 family protein [Hydrogenimonas sp. SS33]|uniref:PP0621 family protein n=1 Tax=Hydrogenimonas leucolamina TaxID=2954236 RepID=UPI00336C18D5